MARLHGLLPTASDGLPVGDRNTPRTGSRGPAPAIPIARAADLWLADLRSLNASSKSIEDRAGALRRFCWWLEHVAGLEATLEALTSPTAREFLAYCREPNPEGRFGSSHPNAKRAARPSTLATIYRDLRSFARFCEGEGLMVEPLKNLKAPRVPDDQIDPLTEEEVQKLLEAARLTACPERDRALMLVLLDSGMRLGELLSLKLADVADDGSHVMIVGKGNKRRAAFLGRTARKALRLYLVRCRSRADASEPLFVSVGGTRPGEVLRGDGVRQILRRCAKLAGIKRSVGAHDFRRTFGISFLRNGGSLLHLQDLLGHQDATVLRKYAKLCRQDLETGHRLYSPADRMKLR